MTNKIAKCSVIMFALVSSTAAFAAETQIRTRDLRKPVLSTPTDESNFECPELTGGTVRIDSTFNVPSGWTFMPKIYSGMSLRRVGHSVSPEALWCNYTYKTGPEGYLIMTTIMRRAPSGKTCTAVADFRFTCN